MNFFLGGGTELPKVPPGKKKLTPTDRFVRIENAVHVVEEGEAGVAVVVPVKGAIIDAGMLIAHLEERLSKYKWPRRFFFWDSLPTSGYGKVPKYMIREKLFEEGALTKDEPV